MFSLLNPIITQQGQKRNHTRGVEEIRECAGRKVGDTMQAIRAEVFVSVRSAMASGVLKMGFWFPAYPAD